MNRYLEKIAKTLSDENKNVAHTFIESAALGVPSHLAGGWAGAKIGNKFGGKAALGATIGTMAAGGLTDLIALKRGAIRQRAENKGK